MVNLWLFSYLHHFLHNALIATDNVCGVISLLVFHSPILYSTESYTDGRYKGLL